MELALYIYNIYIYIWGPGLKQLKHVLFEGNAVEQKGPELKIMMIIFYYNIYTFFLRKNRQLPGSNGTDGATGPSGVPGFNGTDGATGPQGLIGPRGYNGTCTCLNDTSIKYTSIGDVYLLLLLLLVLNLATLYYACYKKKIKKTKERKASLAVVPGSNN